jgi:GGDEF domain-containing protein
MYQGGRLQGVGAAFVAQVVGCQPPQFVVDQGRKEIDRCAVALFPLEQKLRDLALPLHNLISLAIFCGIRAGGSPVFGRYERCMAALTATQSSLNPLEKAHQQREALVDCYLHAIRNSANYAVELDEELTGAHRKYLRALADEVASGEAAALLESRATLRNILRDYRDKGAQYLSALRDELAGTARALEEILDSLSQADGDHETRLRGAVKQLREAADTPDGGAFRNILFHAAESIEQSVESMRKQHQVTISQFQIEIRMLHKRIDTLEAAASIDHLTRFYNREELAERIKSAAPGTYCLLLVSARGLRRAEMQFGPPICEELAGAFAKRLKNSLPPNAVLGRWGMEELVALVQMKKAEALASGKWITEHLSGTYACLHGGKTVRPALQLNVGVVDTIPGEAPARVLERVGVFLTGA